MRAGRSACSGVARGVLRNPDRDHLLSEPPMVDLGLAHPDTSSARSFCSPLPSSHLASGSFPTRRPPSSKIYPLGKARAWSPGEGTQPSGQGADWWSLWPRAPHRAVCRAGAALGRPAVAAGDSAGGIWGHSSQLPNSGRLRPLPHRCQEALLLRPSLLPPGTTRSSQ